MSRSIANVTPHTTITHTTPQRTTARIKRLTPTEYALEYHGLLINDTRQQLFSAVNITRYQNGPREQTSRERHLLKAAIAQILGVRKLPSVFHFPPNDILDSIEPFYCQGLRRAFGGKGSPAEMADALRLAVRCGRIGKDAPYPTLALYATQFLGLDCNGLVGNYFGLSPEVSIGGWALGEPGKLLSWSEAKQHKFGWGAAELATAPYIPLQPRHSAFEAQNGDVLITVAGDQEFKHIALVDQVTPIHEDRVRWSIVEWGQAGSRDKHIGQIREFNLVKGSKKGFGAGLAGDGKFRYLFAGPNTPWEPAKWGRCGREDI